MLYFAVTNSEAFFSHYFYGSTQQDFSFMLEHPWNTVAQKSSLTMVTQRRLLDITGCVTFLHLPSALWWPVPLLLHHLHSGLVSHIATYLSIGFKRERERERGIDLNGCVLDVVLGMMYFAMVGLWQRHTLECAEGLSGQGHEDGGRRTTCRKNPGKTINTCSFRVAHNYTWHVDNRQLLS